MATNNKKPVTEVTAEESKAADSGSKKVEKTAKTAAKPTSEAKESTYSVAELANAHKIFDASYEIVAVALKIAGKERATEAEAKAIVEEFKNKEVK